MVRENEEIKKKKKICDFANANVYCRMFDFCDSIIQRYD